MVQPRRQRQPRPKTHSHHRYPGIPVIALSQLNRESEARAHKRPSMADLVIPKWRNGTPLDLKLRFDAHIMRFEEWSP